MPSITMLQSHSVFLIGERFVPPTALTNFFNRETAILYAHQISPNNEVSRSKGLDPGQSFTLYVVIFSSVDILLMGFTVALRLGRDC